MRTFVAALFLSLMQALPAQAAAPDHGRIVAAVSSRFLAPRYKALAEAGRDNAAAWKSFCGGRGERSHVGAGGQHPGLPFPDRGAAGGVVRGGRESQRSEQHRYGQSSRDGQ